MAQQDDSEEKSHEPTEKKKRDARQDGQVLSSKEMFVFAIIAAGTGLLALAGLAGPKLAGRWAAYFSFGAGGASALDQQMTLRLSQLWSEVLLGGMLFALPLAVVAIGMQMAMGGLNFAPKAFMPNFGKIDPLKGLKRLVSMQALVDLGKGILKISSLGALAVMALYPQLESFGALVEFETAVALGAVWGAIIGLLGWLCLGLAAIGGLDLGWQIVSMRKKLMMSFQEVKQENKEANGSPEMRGALRRMQREASQRGAEQRAALSDVPRATAIVTNPTHFAVALRYVPHETPAPVVIAMGKGPMAQEIIARGSAARIHVLQSALLARALYFTSRIGSEISEQLFGAVAAVLAYVYRLEHGQFSEMPEIDVPQALRFNEFGRPQAKE